MPGKKNTTKPRGAMAEAANDKNERAIASVLGGGEAHFARVEKNLGSYFKLIYHDGSALHLDIQGEPRGIFSARGKVRVKISAGDIVLLEGVQRLSEAKARGKTLIVEIIGRLSKKEAQHLYRAKRIHKHVYSSDGGDAGELDDLFDYGGEDDEDAADSEDQEVDIQANIKRGKVIRARKMVSSAEKTTGRGSGGATGRAGGAGRAVNAVREALDATSYAAGIRADAEDEEVDLEAMAEGMGAAAPKPKKAAPEPAPQLGGAAAAAPSASAEEWAEESPAPNLKLYENWEDAADELDIDAI